MFKKRYLTLAATFLFLVVAFFLSDLRLHSNRPLLHVYNWYGMIDHDIIARFEKETGIRIRLDFYDNNEMVEAKLLAGKSGYDIVFPSVIPYVPRLIQADALEKIDFKAIPNLLFLDDDILQRLNKVDPKHCYTIPYFWGVLGIAYNKTKVQEILKSVGIKDPPQDYRLLFDPTIVKHLSKCGVTLLEESIDIYPTLQRYLGHSHETESFENLQHSQEHLLKIRPFISHLSSTRFVTELRNQETCVAQAWSGDAHLVKTGLCTKERNTFEFIAPAGSTLWIDSMIIPKGALHKKNAYKFINFLFRPDIAALICNRKHIRIAHKKLEHLLKPNILADKTIFIPPDLMKDMKLDVPYSKKYEKKQTQLWQTFKSHSKK